MSASEGACSDDAAHCTGMETPGCCGADWGVRGRRVMACGCDTSSVAGMRLMIAAEASVGDVSASVESHCYYVTRCHQKRTSMTDMTCRTSSAGAGRTCCRGYRAADSLSRKQRALVIIKYKMFIAVHMFCFTECSKALYITHF